MVKRKCRRPTCKVIFKPRTWRHEFCSRKCFKEMYKEVEKERRKKFPDFKCPECGLVQKLTFYPKKNMKSWYELRCQGVGCGFSNMERASEE